MALGSEEQCGKVNFLVMGVHTSKSSGCVWKPPPESMMETPRPALVRHTHSWNAGHALTRGGKGRQRFLRQNGGEKWRWGPKKSGIRIPSSMSPPTVMAIEEANPLTFCWAQGNDQ